jgi:hypothetical protein
VVDKGADWRPLMEMPQALHEEVLKAIKKRNDAAKQQAQRGRRRG